MKRFWKDVSVDAERGVRLDDRRVRTPGRAALLLPSATLAEAVADEWRAVGDDIDPRAMPLTGLANAAIDRIAPEPAAFAAGLAAYGESDLLCYRADGPADLVARQAATWDPPLDWARDRYDVHFEIATGVMHRPQPEATVERLAAAIAARPAFELAPLSPIVTITGSLVLALALAERAMHADTVWAAANLDEDWQAEQWGEDDLAIKARETRRKDFDAAARFLSLV
ncbi:MAG: ATP12 family chaperone protein [Sphingomonas sp.]|uniref:ATP12 family chaperone protein n=1 Tax=Sphingomonas sp. TaxID=28214 RepID=UPI003F7F3DA0